MPSADRLPTTDTATAPLAVDELRHPVVFYDGVCGLCNATVDGLIRRDRRGVLRFAPLQGTTAEEAVPAADRESLGSLLLLTEKGLFRRSAAVVRILRAIGGWSAVLGSLLWLVPLPLRDLGYRIVARYRYNWFGKKESCRMPTEEERGRLLP